MPQAALFLGTFIYESIGLASVGALTVAGTSIAEVTGAVVISTGLSIGSQLLTGGGLPKPVDGKINKRQSIPVRVSGFGIARLGGFTMLYEEKAGIAYQVFALHDGRIDGFETYFLHEDEVTVSGGTVNGLADGRYGSSKIKLATRMGLDTETAYADTVSGLPAIWTSAHRGDGIASLQLICDKVSAADFQKIYPSQLPQPSAAARLQWCWDPRDVGQDHTDEDTWTFTKNPVLHLLRYITSANGMDQDIESRIIPEIDSWKAAADVCDVDVALSGGGTEKRYEAGGFYQHDNDPADVIGTILATFDGWLGETGSGALRVFAGAYYEPTVSIPAAHITGFQVQRFMPDEQAINVLNFTWTSPAQRYTEVDGQAWRDEADIAARGRERARPVSLSWVQSHSQGRRLCKREMHRQTAPARGSIQTDLYGFVALGERYVSLTIPDLPSLGTFAAQLSNARINLDSRTLSFDWVLVTSAIDAWNPATEEGAAPADPDGLELVAPTAPDAPDISAVGADD